MKTYNLEKIERQTRIKAILMALAIHAALLASLFYINNEKITAILPEMVKEWLDKPLQKTNPEKPVAVVDFKA